MKCLPSSIAKLTLTTLICVLPVIGLWEGSVSYAYAVSAPARHILADCQTSNRICTGGSGSLEVKQDEPSILFYSNRSGSGNHMSYTLTLPKDPSSSRKHSSSFNFQLYSVFWFGMAVCDTQSYPEQVSTCTPDSDTNIVDPAVSSQHPGTAFMELQFYPPGWVQRPAGMSCDAKKWCAALVISSLSENPVTGQTNNALCQSIAGLQYTNFAFITKNGVPRFGGPPNPVQSNAFTFTPDLSIDLLMNPGDQIRVKMHDTPNGLMVVLNDQTTGQNGSMTASGANRFGQVQFDPTGTSCNYIPYDFHPMYNTSSEMTSVPWMTHSYNISFASTIGQFDSCNIVNSSGTCEDNNNTNCFPSSASLLVHVAGCIETNTNFAGISYHPVWPNGNTVQHPTSVLFTSPLTGSGYNVNYSRFAFETDLPYLESTNGQCNINTGTGCMLIPQAVAFYPFFSTRQINGHCVWQFGGTVPGSTNDFHANRQYGTLLKLIYTNLGEGTNTQYNDFRQVFSNNPCKA